MTLGRYVSDLQSGDVFEPVTFVITAAVARTFCHGFEETSEWFHAAGTDRPQLVPPTTIHTTKMRLLKKNCPAGDGPFPKLVVEYDATHHGAIPADVPLVASGQVVERYEKRGRDYVHTQVELRLAADGRLLVSYSDRMLLRHEPGRAATP